MSDQSMRLDLRRSSMFSAAKALNELFCEAKSTDHLSFFIVKWSIDLRRWCLWWSCRHLAKWQVVGFELKQPLFKLKPPLA